MNTAGWMLTENGRQPWIVQGLMKTVERELAVGQLDRHLDQPDRVRADLHRARRRRPGPDAALLAPRACEPTRRQPSRCGAAARPRADLLDAMHLHTLWFVIIAVFWVGFFVLEGFDFGVGDAAHGRRPRPRPSARVAINTIGPLWDGNEVWLIVAGAGDVRGVPRLVRDDVLGPVPGAAARARRADGARRRVRVPRQARRAALARALDAGPDGRQRADPAAARRRASATCSPACRSTRSHEFTGQLLRPADPLRPVDRA